jgi:hypothetical protein
MRSIDAVPASNAVAAAPVKSKSRRFMAFLLFPFDADTSSLKRRLRAGSAWAAGAECTLVNRAGHRRGSRAIDRKP